MKRKRYTDEQIAYALRQAEAGTSIKEVCRKLGVTVFSFIPKCGDILADFKNTTSFYLNLLPSSLFRWSPTTLWPMEPKWTWSTNRVSGWFLRAWSVSMK